MELKPVNAGATQGTPIRTPDQLEIKEDGSVGILSTQDKVDVQKKPKKGVVMKAFESGAKTIFTGVGFGSGLVGGGIIGAGIGASGGLLSGLATSSLSLANLGTAGMIGGIAGAIIFGAAGAVGGWQFGSLLIKGATMMKNLLFTERPLAPEDAAAYDMIRQAEDSKKDTRQGFNYISKHLAADETIGQEAELYCGLLGHFTNKETDEALSAYATLKKHLAPGDERKAALSALGSYAKLFSSPQSAMDALYMVMTGRQDGETIEQESQNFGLTAQTLKDGVVDYEVVDPELTGKVYTYMKGHFTPAERKEAIEATLGQFKDRKMKPEETVKNLETVVNNRAKGEDLRFETGNLLGLLEMTGDNGDAGRKVYLEVKKFLPPGDERASVLPELKALAQTFGNTGGGLEALFTIMKNLGKSDTLAAESKSLQDLAGTLRKCVPQGTDIVPGDACDAYSFFNGNFSPEERGTAISSTLGVFEGKKMAPGEIMKNLETLVKSQEKGDDLATEAKNLIGVIDMTGSGEGGREVYASMKKFLPPGEVRKNVLSELEKLSQTFGNTESAIDALGIVFSNLKANDRFEEETEKLRNTADALRKCTDPSAQITPDIAGQAYVAIKNNFPPEKQKDALNDTIGEFGARKLSPEDAIGALKTLIKWDQAGDTLKIETGTLFGLLDRTDGHLDTAENLFGLTKQFCAPGEAREKALLEFDRCKKYFGTAENGFYALSAALGCLQKGETLETEAEQIRTIATTIKECSTTAAPVSPQTACEVYTTFKDNFAADVRKDAIASTLEKFGQYRKLDPGDTVENVKLLVSSLKKEDTLAAETDYLMVLPDVTGGSMAAARGVYSAAKKSLPSPEERKQVPDELKRFAQTFKSSQEAISALNIALSSLNKGDTLAQESEFLRTCAGQLNTCSGKPIDTKTAGGAYGILKSNFASSERGAALADTLGVFSKYGKTEPQDAVENLRLMVSSQKKDDRLADESAYLMGLREKTSGRMDVARKVYSDAKQYLKPGSDRAQLPGELDSLSQTFRSNDEGINALNLVLTHLNAQESFTAETANFINFAEFLKQSTSDSISSKAAWDIYATIEANFAPDERAHVISATMGQFGRYTRLSLSDLKENLNLLISTQQKGEDLATETQTLMELLKTTGGNMADARAVYGSAKKYLPPGPERNMIPGELSRFTQTFGSTKEGLEALQLTLKNLKSNESFTGESENLRACADYLKQCGGSTPQSETATDAYGILQSNFTPDERRRIMDRTLGQLVNTRMSADEAARTLKKLIETRQSGEDLGKETYILMELIKKTQKSDVAHKVYDTFKREFSPSDRDQALACYLTLLSREGSADEAHDSFQQLNDNRYSDDNFSDCVKNYEEIYGACGSSYSVHRSALALYKTIASYSRAGGDRDSAVDALIRLISTERRVTSDLDNIKRDLEFIHDHMSYGERISQEIDKFAGFLGSSSSSSGAQEKYLESKFEETWR